MPVGTDYNGLMSGIVKDIINHGWGEMIFKVQTLKDGTSRIDILAGRQYVFFIKKEINYNKTII